MKRALSSVFLASVLLSGCGAAQSGAGATTTVVSIRNLDCVDCPESIVAGMLETEGVQSATFDKRKAEIRVVAEPSVDVVKLARALAPEEGYEILLGAGQGSYLPWATPPETADVVLVAKDGADVPDLTPHLAKGKLTIVDFGASWCEPCRELDAHVIELLRTRPDVAYRKLDVADWDSPLAARWLKGVPALPYVIVFDATGKQKDAFSGLDLARLDRALAPAK